MRSKFKPCTVFNIPFRLFQEFFPHDVVDQDCRTEIQSRGITVSLNPITYFLKYFDYIF